MPNRIEPKHRYEAFCVFEGDLIIPSTTRVSRLQAINDFVVERTRPVPEDATQRRLAWEQWKADGYRCARIVITED